MQNLVINFKKFRQGSKTIFYVTEFLPRTSGSSGTTNDASQIL